MSETINKIQAIWISIALVAILVVGGLGFAVVQSNNDIAQQQYEQNERLNRQQVRDSCIQRKVDNGMSRFLAGFDC